MKFQQFMIATISCLLVTQPVEAKAGFFDLPGNPAAYPESSTITPTTVAVGGTVTLAIRVVAGDRVLNSNLDAYAITSTARKIYLGPIASRISGTNMDGIYQVTFKVLEYGSPSNTHTGGWKLGVVPSDFAVDGYPAYVSFSVVEMVAPTPTPTPTPPSGVAPKKNIEPTSPAKKSLTIKCVKGKSFKLITGVNPKCPSGYKKA